MVDFGLEQGLSNFETDSVAVTVITGIAELCRGFQKSENAALGQKMPFADQTIEMASFGNIAVFYTTVHTDPAVQTSE